MPNVSLNRNGAYWLARWRDQAGKCRGKSLGRVDAMSKAAARAAAHDLEARLKRLRSELQVPEKDDPMATGERGGKPGAKGKKAGAAKKPAEGTK